MNGGRPSGSACSSLEDGSCWYEDSALPAISSKSLEWWKLPSIKAANESSRCKYSSLTAFELGAEASYVSLGFLVVNI